MKLYYAPMTCSLATHIACLEAGIEFERVRVELGSKRSAAGEDLRSLNAMELVPTIVTDDGHTLTENTAVLTYVGDRSAEGRLAPAKGTFERYELARWLGFIATEIHKKGLALIYDRSSPEAVKAYAREGLAKPLGVADAHLEKNEHLLGAKFTVADAYLYWALTIAPLGGVSLDPYPALRAYRKRIFARPAVRAALELERAEWERAQADPS
jgi:glutathione S-transferase